MRRVFADVRQARLAGRIRWAREQVSEVGLSLAEIGREDLLFEITNLELQLHELHLNLMKPLREPAPLASGQNRANRRGQARTLAKGHVTR